MKLARYLGGGKIAIVDEPTPKCPPGGLLVKTEACGLCSGELMDWYMDRKVPHVFGHEVAGIVVESEDERFPVGARVFPHHHAPCMSCEECRRYAYVHCEKWKRTKLDPGGMAEYFAVGAENLNDTHRVDDLQPEDAAMIEPLACVWKSIASVNEPAPTLSVIGLGAMGLMHLMALKGNHGMIGYDLRPERIEYALSLGLEVRHADEIRPSHLVFVCPGTPEAIRVAVRSTLPRSRIVLFSPIGPPGEMMLPIDELYFKEIYVTASYSSGPADTAKAIEIIRSRDITAAQIVSDFVTLGELPEAYRAMKAGEIRKAMVRF
jgi:L-iditol 2-dehydrogenase